MNLSKETKKELKFLLDNGYQESVEYVIGTIYDLAKNNEITPKEMKQFVVVHERDIDGG